MILVLNEWVFHDLLLDNGDAAFQETARFLIAFRESEDILVVPAEERWKRKAFQLMTMADIRQRLVSRLLHGLLRDSNRTIRIQPEANPRSPRSCSTGCPVRMSTWCGLTSPPARTFSSPLTRGCFAPSVIMMSSTAECANNSWLNIHSQAAASEHHALPPAAAMPATNRISPEGQEVTLRD